MKEKLIEPLNFGAVNYTVLVIYLAAMLVVGLWCGRKVKTARGFFVAEGKLNHVLVGLSLLGTYLSALTMMALSGVAFGKFDMTWSVQLPFLILTAFVITKFVLPRYREANVISVYEFLEQRIHVSSRLLAAICFCIFGIARMGIVLYLPALAFHIITGFDLGWTIIVMGLVITAYTVIGGIEAVVWTDAVQVILFSLAAVVTLLFIFTGLGDADFWEVARQNNKLRHFFWAPEEKGEIFTEALTWWLVLETIFQTIRIYGTQQDMTQRYMATESTEKANRSVWIAILGYIPLGYAFYFIGASLFVYYQINPDASVAALVDANKNDAIYPYFIAAKLPVGLAGAVIAAIFAAAMSSIDSLLNSTSTVIVEDFYKRASEDPDSRPDAHYLMVARVLTVVLGLFVTVAAVTFIGGDTPMQIVFSKAMSILTNGVLGLMALAFLPFKVNKWAAVIGFAASYVLLLLLMYPAKFGLEGLNIVWLLRPVICNPFCFVVALIVHAVLGRSDEPTAAVD